LRCWRAATAGLYEYGGTVNLTCSVSFADEMATIIPVGDIDVDSTSKLRDVLQLAAVRPGITSVMVDLGGVTFMDSSALGVLVAARRNAETRGASFGVRNPGPMVTMVLQITGLYDDLVTEKADLADA
jgi:anti-sigma B factor antagonist